MNLVFGFLLHFDFWLYLTYVIHCKWVAGIDDPADSILCGSFTAQGRIIFELFFVTLPVAARRVGSDEEETAAPAPSVTSDMIEDDDNDDAVDQSLDEDEEDRLIARYAEQMDRAVA
jgi:hypothetical protein